MIKLLKDKKTKMCKIEKWIKKGREICMREESNEDCEIEDEVKGMMRGFFDEATAARIGSLSKADQVRIQSSLIELLEKKVTKRN